MSEISFGRWLSARRHLLDLTQEELARRVGCSVVTIRKLEADERRPSKQIAERLADCLQIGLDDRPSFLQLARGEPRTESPALQLPNRSPSTTRASAHRTNLASPLTPLIGRAQDMAAARNRLLQDTTRLLTLIGPPGIGKTRLALAVAQVVQDSFPDGVCFVALASISDPKLVVPTIMQALGLPERNDSPSSAHLRAYLCDKHMLLVLDNFEQILEAAPQLVDLLAEAPHLTILVTSRTALRVRGEQLMPVPPLLLPDSANLPPTDQLAQTPAVALFVDRVRAVAPAFTLTDEHAVAIAAICIRLDGLPLAIELAAARARLLPPKALLDRLDKRLPLLTEGPRDLPARQQTLHNAIAWSYDLLDPTEQTLFARLGVFVGGCTLEAAEAVLTDGVAEEANVAVCISAQAVLEGLGTLVDRSLLRRIDNLGEQPRLLMLETIREFALERLAQSGEEAVISARHARCFAAYAAQQGVRIVDAQVQERLEHLETDHANIRAALRWCEEHGDFPSVARISYHLWWSWCMNGHRREGYERLDRMLATSASTLTAEDRARALLTAGVLALELGMDLRSQRLLDEYLRLIAPHQVDVRDHALALSRLATATHNLSDSERAGELLVASIDLCRRHALPLELADVLGHFALYALWEGDFPAAVAAAEESHAIYGALEHREGMMRCLINLGLIAIHQADVQEAEGHYCEAERLARQNDDRVGLAAAAIGLGMVDEERGDYTGAARRYRAYLDLSQQLNDQRGKVLGRYYLAAAMLLAGDSQLAAQLCREVLRLSQDFGFVEGICWGLAGMGAIAALNGRPERTARLFGASIGLTAHTKPQPLFPSRQALAGRCIAVAQGALGDAAYIAAFTAGQALTIEQAVAEAIVEDGRTADVSGRTIQ